MIAKSIFSQEYKIHLDNFAKYYVYNRKTKRNSFKDGSRDFQTEGWKLTQRNMIMGILSTKFP